LEEASFDSDRISRAQWRRHIGSRSAAVFVSGTRTGIDAAAVVFYRRYAEADARARGCTSMRLEVRADNASAIALYERRGYARVVRLPGFYEDGADGW